MAHIFQDAANDLHTPRQPSLPRSRRMFACPDAISPSGNSPNSKRSRFTLPCGRDMLSPPCTSPTGEGTNDCSSDRNDHFPTTVTPKVPEQVHELPSDALNPSLPVIPPDRKYLGSIGQEPLSSGFTSKIGPLEQNPHMMIDASLSMYPDLDDEETHSTHGVPLVIPIRFCEDEVPVPLTTNVDAWLDQIVEHTSYSTPDLQENLSQTPNLDTAQCLTKPNAHLRLASNKENIPPTSTTTIALSWSSLLSSRSQSPDPSPRHLIASLRSPRKFSSRGCLSAAGSPTMLLSVPPKRRRTNIIIVDSPARSLVKENPDSLEFDFCEDEQPTGLVELSPHVERHRKGKGPKKERCPSYMDQDVLPEFSPTRELGKGKAVRGRKDNVKVDTKKGKKALRGNARTVRLTK